MSSKQIVSNDHHASRFFLSSANSWLGLDFFPSKGGKCMGYYSFDSRNAWDIILSTREVFFPRGQVLVFIKD